MTESPQAESIGQAVMLDDGTLVLDLVATGPDGARGHGQLRYPVDHPRYREILAHLGAMTPGKPVVVRPFPPSGSQATTRPGTRDVAGETIRIASDLLALSDVTKASLERVLGQPLDPARAVNPQFDLYAATSSSHVWQALDARVPKGRGGATIVITFSTPRATLDDLRRAFGEPASVEPHIVEPRDCFDNKPLALTLGESIARFRSANSPSAAWVLDADGHARTLIITYGR